MHVYERGKLAVGAAYTITGEESKSDMFHVKHIGGKRAIERPNKPEHGGDFQIQNMTDPMPPSDILFGDSVKSINLTQHPSRTKAG